MANAKDPKMQFRYKGKVLHWNKDMSKLAMEDLVLVEYRLENSTVFKRMFLKKAQGLCCQICSTNAMAGKASMDAHINGKKHQRAIELIVEYSHQIIKNLDQEDGAATTKATPAAKSAAAATPAKAVAVTSATPKTVAGAATNLPSNTPAVAAAAKATPAKHGTAAISATTNAKPAAACAKPAVVPGTTKPVAAGAKSAAIPGTTKPAPKPGTPKPVAKASTPGTPKPAAGAVAPKPATTPGTPKPAAAPGTPKPAVTPGTPKVGGAATTPTSAKPGANTAKPAAATPAKPAAATPAKTAAGAAKPAAKGSTPAAKATVGPAKAGVTKLATPVAKATASNTPVVKTTVKPATPATKPAVKTVANPIPTTKELPTTGEKDNKPRIPTDKNLTAEGASPPVKAEIKSSDVEADEPIPMETDEANAALKSDTVVVNEPEIEVVDLLSDSEEASTKVKNVPLNESVKTTTDTDEKIDKDKTTEATTTDKGVVNSNTNKSTDDEILDPTTIRQIKTLKSAVPTLGLDELKKVEFRTADADWTKLITEAGGKYSCNVCKQNDIKSFFDLKTHMNQDNHKSQITAIQHLHHPVMCPVKFASKTTRVFDGTELKAKQRELVNQKTKITGPVPLEDFKLKHVLLPVAELLKVEYRGKSNIWYNMIHKNGSTFKCVLCKTPFMGNFKNILEHVHGRKHLLAAHELTSLHHPVYCIASDRAEKVANVGQADKIGKENLVINPVAVMKGTADAARKTTPPAPSGRKIPTVSNNDTPLGKRPAPSAPGGGPQNKRAATTHPGLQPQNQQTKGPSFSNKVITNKPDTDAHIEGYIGVEYVVKILRNATDPSPRFECCLCELDSDGYGMQSHLKSSPHRLKYLDRHFRTVMREFESLRNDLSCKNVLHEIARLLAVAIEKHHGRDLPFECLQDEYRINRPEIMAKVFSFRHASELSGPSMIHVIDKMTLNDMLQNKESFGNKQPEAKRRTTFDVRDEMAPKRFRMEDENFLDVDEHRRLVDQFLRNTNRDNADRRHRSRSKGRSRSRGRSRDRWMEQGRGRRSRSRSMGRRRSHSGDLWSTYKRMFDHSIRDLDTDYKRFERDPETHPLYQKEWKIFWQKRSEELANDGRDPTSYDFQPEWILFWTRRMDQIYEEEVDHLKKKLRDRLNLPYHNNDLRERRYHLGVHRQPTSAFSQIRQSMDNMGPRGPNIGHGPNVIGVDVPPLEGPDGPFMGRSEGPRMGGPHGPFMGGQPGPHMGGPSGPIMSGPGGQHMGGPGGPIMGGSGGPMMGGPGGQHIGGSGGLHMGGPGGPHVGGPGGPNMGGPHMGGPFIGGPGGPMSGHGGPRMGGSGGPNMGGPPAMGPGGDNAPFNRNHPNSGPWSGPNFGPQQDNNMAEKIQPNQPAAGMKQMPLQRTIRPLLPSNPNQNVNVGPKPQQQQDKQQPLQQRQKPQQANRNVQENQQNKQQKESIGVSGKNLKSNKHASDKQVDNQIQTIVDDDEMDSSPLTVLSVLRLLAALEDHLGILGPRVVDLMAKALTLEKAKPGSADRNLITPENTVFLETVREKLRGQIVVGVLDASKTRAVNNAIKVVTELLNKNLSNEPLPAVERLEITKQPQPAPMAPARVSQQKPSNSNDAEEKRDLAAKLAAALAAQGKTNVTSDQLEQLIAVYSLIEKKQKENTNEPKKQNLSDLLVDSLKETSPRTGENNAMSDGNRNASVFENRGQQRPPQLMDIQPYAGLNSNSCNRPFQSSGGNSYQSNSSGFGQSSSNLPSFMTSSFSLSNFDTSLSLSSLPPLNFTRNQDSNRQQINTSEFGNSSQNTPAFMTNMGRGGTNSKQDMVSYPSIWQRGGTTPTTTNRNESANKQAPLGWQQTNANNRNSGNWPQNRSRR